MAKPNPEFALHVHKLTATAEHQDLYTIGIWQGTTLHALCHVQPIDQALGTLRNALDQAGTPHLEALPVQASKSAQSTLRTDRRRLVAAMLASLESFIGWVRWRRNHES